VGEVLARAPGGMFGYVMTKTDGKPNDGLKWKEPGEPGRVFVPFREMMGSVRQELAVVGRGSFVVPHGLRNTDKEFLNGRICVLTSPSVVERDGCQCLSFTLSKNWCIDLQSVKRTIDEDPSSFFVVPLEKLRACEPPDFNSNSMCGGCGDTFVGPRFLKCCSACKVTFYCSKTCQVSHWREKHKMECRSQRRLRKDRFDDDALPTERTARLQMRCDRIALFLRRNEFPDAVIECEAAIEEGHSSDWLYVWMATALCKQDEVGNKAKIVELLDYAAGLSMQRTDLAQKRLALTTAFRVRFATLWAAGAGAEARDAARALLAMYPNDTVAARYLQHVNSPLGIRVLLVNWVVASNRSPDFSPTIL
jgi:hypothetical protein